MSQEINHKLISSLISKEAKTATYKFALLRGAIEIVTSYYHLRKTTNKGIEYPMGLLVYKWLLYYYPILARDIPQIRGKGLAFEKLFKEVITCYGGISGYAVFAEHLKNGNYPTHLQNKMYTLILKIRTRIYKMPMYFFGNSPYYYFDAQLNSLPIKAEGDLIDLSYLVEKLGTLVMKNEIERIFHDIGGVFIGEDSLLIQWAEESCKISKGRISKNEMLDVLTTTWEVERNVYNVKHILKTNQNNICIWSNNIIKELAIDHIIPFVASKNNDMWNLQPSEAKINNKKRDKIPTRDLLLNSQQQIFENWDTYLQNYSNLFIKEIRVSLIGDEDFNDNWKFKAFEQIIMKCNYLVDYRGFERFELKKI